MIFTKKTVSIILALALALSLCPMAFAAGSVNTYSSNIVSFIKSFEGFEPNVYEDKLVPGTYSIGYGFVCGKDDFPDGITEAEAEKQMTDYLDTKVVPVLNSFVSENGITLSQNQYDALVSFTYNLGTGWMNDGYRIYRYLKAGVSNYTDAQIADAIGVCGHAGGVAVEGLIARRIREAQVFLYGDYTGKNCPQYNWMIINPNGGKVENDILFYPSGKSYGTLPTASLTGKYFGGWKNDATGAMLSAEDLVSGNVRATAVWSDKVILPYTDVADNAWYREAVAYTFTNGLMDGVTQTSFEPNTRMSRAMLVTVLWRQAGKPTVNYAMPFTDVKADSWYTEAVRWAASPDIGITTGISDTSFAPDSFVTREQMVSFMYRFAKQQGQNVGDGTGAMGLAGYVDSGSVSEYAYPAFLWAVQKGVVKGTETPSGPMLTPKATANRAQVAQVLQNYCTMASL